MLGPGGKEGQFAQVACPLCKAEERVVVHADATDLLLGHPGRFCVVECAACSVRYLDPQPIGSTLIGYYGPNGERTYPDNEARRAKTYPDEVRHALHRDRGYPAPSGPPPGARALARGRRRLRKDRDTWRLLPWRGEGRLLDVGCGSGRYMGTMATLGWTPEGTNVIAQACEAVRTRLRLPCHEGDLLDLDLPRCGYDAVTLWHVLEHVPDPPAVLARIRDLLAPGGVLGIGVPVYDCPQAERLGTAWLGYEVPRHLVTFSRRRLTSFLLECGFRMDGLHSEARSKVIRISVQRGKAPWWLRTIAARRRLLGWYAGYLTRRDRIGTVVALATRL